MCGIRVIVMVKIATGRTKPRQWNACRKQNLNATRSPITVSVYFRGKCVGKIFYRIGWHPCIFFCGGYEYLYLVAKNLRSCIVIIIIVNLIYVRLGVVYVQLSIVCVCCCRFRCECDSDRACARHRQRGWTCRYRRHRCMILRNMTGI